MRGRGGKAKGFFLLRAARGELKRERVLKREEGGKESPSLLLPSLPA